MYWHPRMHKSMYLFTVYYAKSTQQAYYMFFFFFRFLVLMFNWPITLRWFQGYNRMIWSLCISWNDPKMSLAHIYHLMWIKTFHVWWGHWSFNIFITYVASFPGTPITQFLIMSLYCPLKLWCFFPPSIFIPLSSSGWITSLIHLQVHGLICVIGILLFDYPLNFFQICVFLFLKLPLGSFLWTWQLHLPCLCEVVIIPSSKPLPTNSDTCITSSLVPMDFFLLRISPIFSAALDCLFDIVNMLPLCRL